MFGEVDTIRARDRRLRVNRADCQQRDADSRDEALPACRVAARHHAREKRLPVLPVTARSDPLTPASCSSLRPNSHEQIRQTVDVGQDARLDDDAVLLKAHQRALGAAADRPRDVERRGGAMFARDRPVAQHALDRLDPVHFVA